MAAPAMERKPATSGPSHRWLACAPCRSTCVSSSAVESTIRVNPTETLCRLAPHGTSSAVVPPLTASAGTPDKPKSMRDQMATHRANAVCASCHKLMDPIGLALENFDAVGRWRTKDAAGPIDATGDLIDGTHVGGVVQLRQALLKRPEVFVGTMTEKLLTYAIERGVEAPDMPTVRGIVRDATKQDFRFSALVLGVVKSPAFQMRLKTAADPALRTAQR